MRRVAWSGVLEGFATVNWKNRPKMKNKEKLLEQERAFDAKIKNAGKVFTCNDSKLTERMMRCGIEARVFCPDNEDELRHIALVTLKMDAVNSLPSNA